MSDALRFTSLRVRRMPGIVRTGFSLDDLCGGINVVHGPNASGKTTTARALLAALWPESSPPRAALEAGFALGDDDWRVDLDAAVSHWQRDGRDADRPPLPPTDARDRYSFPLHDLLRADDGDFAARIARESAGGYDVAGAAESLGVRATPSRSRSERNALEEARRELRRARREQERLSHDRARLGELEAKRDTAAAATRRLELWDRALERLRARAELDAAENAFAEFPDGMARLHGDEADRLDGIADALDAAREKRRDAEHDLDAATRDREQTRLDGPPPGELLPAVRADLETVERLEREREAAAGRAAHAAERAGQELRAMGDAVDRDTLDEVDDVAFDALAAFAERAERIGARRAALDGERDALRDAASPHDLDRLREGARLLRAWLVAGGGADRQRRLRRIAIAASVLAALAGGLLGLLHPAAVAAAIPGVVLLMLALNRGPASASRSRMEKDFRKLRIDAPMAWRRDAVESRLADLDAQIADGERAQARLERRERLEKELERVAADAQELDQERRDLVARLGVAPETGAIKLYWLANRISRWQDAAREAAAANAELEEMAEQRERAIAAARERLQPFGYDAVQDAAGLAGAVDDLDARRRAYDEAVAAAGRAEARRDEADATIARLTEEREKILDRLGLPSDADATVAEWCGRRDEYVEAVRRRTRAEAGLERTHDALTEHPDYETGVETKTEAQVEEARRADEERARDLDDLREEIVAIRTRVEAAKDGQDLETALAEVEEAEAALRAARDGDIRAMVGHALASFVHDWSRDHDRPAVFRRARELFSAITRGRYRLELDDGEAPAFRALDTTTGRGHALDELSSGTRVQLLLAVRVAFVETQEQGVRLPVLFDETLGNSDDVRANAIMDAVLTLCREGRQVFYFTAQADEVGKWRALLEDADDVDCRFLDLARARSLPSGDGDELRILAVPTAAPPDPEGRDHADYGEALALPPIDPWAPARAAHLWYLVEDVELLHGLLGLGIERWGQLRGLVENGGGELPILAGGVYDRIAAGARVLDAALEAWRIGRGRPVDREVLEDSGAVSDTFIDRAVIACREADGDAERAVRAIGELPRFRGDKLEQLRAYLAENGYLDPDPPLSPDDIRLRALAAAATDIARRRIDEDDVERLIARLRAPAPAS